MRGGKREGAGRPKKITNARRHFIYCDPEEYKFLKEQLEWKRTLESEKYLEKTDYLLNIIIRITPMMPIIIEDLLKKYSGEFKDCNEICKLIETLQINNPDLLLRKYSEGIFYRTVKTVFGEMPMEDRMLLIGNYMPDNGWYTTGYDLLNKLGLCTLVPEYMEIASNVACKNVKIPEFHIKIYPAKTIITKENKAYLTALDAINMLDDISIDTKNPEILINQYIRRNKLRFDTLLSFAKKYYDHEIVDKIHRCEGA